MVDDNVVLFAGSDTNGSERRRNSEGGGWPGSPLREAGADRPTAIFASFDSLAEMIYFLLPRLGLRVPEDVSLLAFGGAWRQGAWMRRLSSVVVDEVATGQTAVSLLHEMRRGDRPIDDNTEVTMKLSVSMGETLVACAPKTSSV
jgi:DNA-binding LacI/PurR family transcriptional regulator